MEYKDNYWNYAQIGLELAVAVLAGFGGGYWLDSKLESSPWFMLAGSAAGIAGGFYLVVRELFPKNGGGVDK